MKLTICIAAVSLLVGTALAQQPGQQPSQSPSSQQSQSGSQSATQSGSQSATQSGSQSATQQSSSSDKPAELKTQTYKGQLRNRVGKTTDGCR
jgi:uncharacterized protein YdeI (BOF family)